MKHLIIITALFLTACAGPQRAMTKVELECEYEAQKATAGIRNGVEATWEKIALYKQCVKIKGML